MRAQKGGITEHFGRIQRGDHSYLLGQCQFESIQNKELSELKPARDVPSCHITNIEPLAP